MKTASFGGYTQRNGGTGVAHLEDEPVQRHRGHIQRYKDGLFSPASWLAVFMGQLNFPEGLDPLIDYRDIDARDWLAKLRSTMTASAAQQPSHAEILQNLQADAQA